MGLKFGAVNSRWRMCHGWLQQYRRARPRGQAFSEKQEIYAGVANLFSWVAFVFRRNSSGRPIPIVMRMHNESILFNDLDVHSFGSAADPRCLFDDGRDKCRRRELEF